MTSTNEQSGDSLIGRVVAERYRIERRIARGGMGVVYVAQDLRLQRPIVFKVLSEHLAGDEKATARFEQEALGLSRLSHPNIVAVYDFGIEDSITYIAMEFVPGITLSDLLRRDGVMSFDTLLPLAVQIVEAIAAAHEKNIVHRDIKPANIMVVSEPGRVDVVKVLDFGLARLTSSSLDITKDNLVGTVSYVAPEVVKGDRAGKPADVYALAVMFYFMLTGRKPFKAEDDLSVLYKHVHDTPAPMQDLLHEGHDVPVAFIDLVHQCMAKDPEDRPADGGALLSALSEVVSLPSIPRMTSGEFLRIQREMAQAAAVASAAPEPSLTEFPSRPSIDLSSMALRERPNSRWGVPLIALCVFVAGAAAILFISNAGESASEHDPELTVEDERALSAPNELPVEAVSGTSPAGGSDLEPGVGSSPEDGESSPGFKDVPVKRPVLQEREPEKPDGKRKREQARSDRQTPTPTTPAASKTDAGGVDPSPSDDGVPTLPTDSKPANLLDVNGSSDSVLLPVD